ncbi:MAG TPA: macro domain-containing protein, partial [Synergistaceae bacterium]|nr:macro domain-containing protein [Synergistaceae bacterium]
LRLAEAHDCKTLAFPSISCGVYGYPPEKACPLALETIREFLQNHDLPEKVYLVCFGETLYSIYKKLLQELS